MKIRVWGAQGSLPAPLGPDALKQGQEGFDIARIYSEKYVILCERRYAYSEESA